MKGKKCRETGHLPRLRSDPVALKATRTDVFSVECSLYGLTSWGDAGALCFSFVAELGHMPGHMPCACCKWNSSSPPPGCPPGRSRRPLPRRSQCCSPWPL